LLDLSTKELYARQGYRYDKAATRYWVDLRYKTSTKEFVWSNDWDVIPYTNWAVGMPFASWAPTTSGCYILFRINSLMIQTYFV